MITIRERYLTTLRVSVLALLLIAAGANTVLTIHQLFFSARAYIGITPVRSADGMTVDKQGRLYVTGREGVLVLTPDGKWIGVIATPEQPANCTFGGPDDDTLFITARTSLYAVKTLPRGWHVHLDGTPNKPRP